VAVGERLEQLFELDGLRARQGLLDERAAAVDERRDGHPSRLATHREV
jgi:hypothetical protein